MSLEHRVFGTPPGKSKSVFFAAYPLEHWQWSMKLAQKLRDNGCTGVVVLKTEAPKKG